MTVEKDIIFRKETHIIITRQAQKVIASTKYTVEDLLEWALLNHMSIGGHDATLFLEYMYNKQNQA